MESLNAKLPEALLAELQALKDVLETQGVVQHRGGDRKQSYRLRYRIKDEDGRYVQRSLELGDEMIAVEVQVLLDEWRSPNRNSSPSKAAHQPLSDTEREDRMLKRHFRQQAKAAGGGRSFQTKVGRMYDAGMYGSDRNAIYFLYNECYLTPPKRGRPRKSKLW